MVNRFNAIKHEYYSDDTQLLSVTKFISRYQRPFNAPMVANMVANKNNRTAEDVLNEWDLKRDIANNYGTSVHLAVEGWIKYGIIPTQPHLQLVVEKFREKFGHIKWESEYRIFNKEYELGGTVDLLSFESGIMADIKTNETNKKGSKGNFIKPLNKLKVNNLNKVRLQTCIYENLIGEDFKKFVYIWNGEDFEEQELEPVDVSELLTERLTEIL